MIRGETKVTLYVLTPGQDSEVRGRKVVLARHHDGGDREAAVQWVKEVRALNPTLVGSFDIVVTRTTEEVL